MNNDIVKKLIELACNNPNENEANAAARKVCRMIKEDNFSILNGSVFTPPRPQPQAPRGPSMEDILRDMQRKAAEAAAREHERVRNANAAWERAEAERREKARKQQAARDKYRDTGYTNATTRNVKCSICGKDKSTLYQGPVEKFMCAVCKFERDKQQRHAGYRK